MFMRFLAILAMSHLLPLHYRRATSKVAPQTETSGDCGVFAMEYIEHCMLERSLELVNDDNMLTFRHRWCVDLFY
uniref:Ubiquitin-like protease family profile domain-containing protein n=1 Tax=Cannabis sativa TaxID=3483 RepID=A0A803R048_CANSA